MNRILPVAFTRDEAQAAGTSISESAKKATSSFDDLIVEIKDFTDRKGFEAMEWKNKKLKRFYEMHLESSGIDYKYFCYLNDCAEFSIAIGVEFAGEVCKPIRALCKISKKYRMPIWDQATVNCRTKIPTTREITKLISEERMRQRKASDQTATAKSAMAYESNTSSAHAKSHRVESIMRHLPSEASDLHNLLETVGKITREAAANPILHTNEDISLNELKQLLVSLKSVTFTSLITGVYP